MLDLDQRVHEGLRDLADRAPVAADVWPATEKYVGKRRRARRAITGGALALVLVAGGLTAAAVTRDDGPSTHVASSGPAVGGLTITAASTGGLTFSPQSLTLRTGLYEITFKNDANAQHTLEFDNPATRWPGLELHGPGAIKTARIFFGKAGNYTFYCKITGHRAAGMFGVVHVDGKPLTYEQAEVAALGN